MFSDYNKGILSPIAISMFLAFYFFVIPNQTTGQAALAQGLCWDVRCGRHVTCGSNECAGSNSSSGGSSYTTTRSRKKTYRPRRRTRSKAQRRRTRQKAAGRVKHKKMLRLNDAGLAYDRTGQYKAAIVEFEKSLSFCKRKKDCKIIRKNLASSRSGLWDKQYEEKRKREKAELKIKKEAAKRQVGKMLYGLGSSWGGNVSGAPATGPTGLGFGPIEGKPAATNANSGLTIGKPGLAGDRMHDTTSSTLKRLRDENRGSLVKLGQSPNAKGAQKKIIDKKTQQDLLTTKFHGKLAASSTGDTAKREAMKGFDTTGEYLAPLPNGIVDLRGRPVDMTGEIPKDIGADIPGAKKQKVGEALSTNAAWKQLKTRRQVIEKKQDSIKTARRKLQNDLSKSATEAERRKVSRKISNTYVQEKEARDQLFKVKVEQKKVAEKVAKEVEIVIIDENDAALPKSKPEATEGIKAAEEPTGDNVSK